MDDVPGQLRALAASLVADLREPMRNGDPAAVLYDAWYLGGPSSVRPWAGPALPSLYRAAHAQSAVFDEGWLVLQADDRGNLLVANGQAQREAGPGDYINSRRPLVPPAPGEQVAVVRRVDHLDESGWWATRSPEGEPDPPLGRHYLHPTIDGAGSVLATVTGRLAELGTRWSIKLPGWPEGFARPDAMVVYAARTDTLAVQAALLDLEGLEDRPPKLTRRVAPGVAYADDPGPGSSYGSVLCQALAPAARAIADGVSEDAPGELRRALGDGGLDPDQPWRLP